MHYPNDPKFPTYPKYFIPATVPAHGVGWQRWFWRSWGLIIIGSIGTNLVLLPLIHGFELLRQELINGRGWLLSLRSIFALSSSGYVIYAVLGLLIGIVFGFWVSFFTTCGLHKRQIQHHEVFWFAVHYAAGAAIVAWIFRFLTQSWRFWSYYSSDIHLVFFYWPITSFIVASGLVGWRMQRWLNRGE